MAANTYTASVSTQGLCKDDRCALRQMLKDFEAHLYRLLKHRSPNDYDALIRRTSSAVPFDSLEERDKLHVVQSVLKKLSHRSVQ